MATGTAASSRYDRPRDKARSAEQQVLVAWLTLATASVLFAGIVIGGTWAGRWVFQNATAPKSATLRLSAGSEARVRGPSESDWRLAQDGLTVREGDWIATSADDSATLTFFDGSTVELMDDTTVEIRRIRSSRFLKRTRLIEVEPLGGLVYATLRSSDDYGYGELTLRNASVVVTTDDSRGSTEDMQLLFEVLAGVTDRQGASAIRVASLQGEIRVESDMARDAVELNAGQQTIFRRGGATASLSAVVREVVVNGDFSDERNDWQVIPSSLAGSVADRVDVVDLGASAPATCAIVFDSADASDAVEGIGIRQQVRRLLAKHGRLTLGLDVMIEETNQTATVVQPPSLTITVTYEDAAREQHEWVRMVVVEDIELSGESDGGELFQGSARIEAGEWRRVMFDLGQSESPVRQITSIVVYASGEGYQTTVTNISLTVQEIGE